MRRIDGRAYDELRPVRITTGVQAFAEGSVIIEMGRTRVLCAASVEERVPAFLRGSGSGWITAEYSMLPRATITRKAREAATGKVGGRSQEIQRFIGRSLRAVVDMDSMGERTITLDCDVLQADGGTRTAAVTGSYVALHMALSKLANMGIIAEVPVRDAVAAVSLGIFHGEMLLDLCYDEDYQASVDFNVVMTGRSEFVEVQGTAEGKPFSRENMDTIVTLAGRGIAELIEKQQAVLDTL